MPSSAAVAGGAHPETDEGPSLKSRPAALSAPWRTHLIVLLAYATVAIAFSWPLSLHLGTTLTGEPGGDTGVYVWNQWVFRHELIEKGNFPYVTDTLFGPNQLTDLSLHNYTTFADLIALPLRTGLGLVEAFNVVYLLLMVIGAYAAYLLAHHVTRNTAASWIAGLAFGWSPVLITRGSGHFSLVAAAPLAVYLLLLCRADRHVRVRDAIALGATVAWASMTDVYYAVFCLLLGAAFVVSRVASIQVRDRPPKRRAFMFVTDGAIVSLVIMIASIAITGGWEVKISRQVISARTLYTPVLMLTGLFAVRLIRRIRLVVVPLTAADFWRFVRLTAASGAATALLTAPLLYTAAVRIMHSEFDTPTIYWRSSPQGADLLALVLPNPNHPLAPDAISQWLDKQPQAYIENVASLPYVVLAILMFAWRIGWRPSRWWVGLGAMFGLLALGPFIHVAGVNTFVPGPWALLRYVPIVGFVHSPTRFIIVFTLCLAVVMADALAALSHRYPHRWRVLAAVAGILLTAELLPAPITLYSADIPPLYRHVAVAPEGTVLLDIPTGVADGVSQLGAFTARTEFNQTAHGKTVVGGFLSRIPRQRAEEVLNDPVHRALAMLSERRTLAPDEEASLLQQGPAFIRRKHIGFVVIDRNRAHPEFEAMIVGAFRLRHVETNGSIVLYSPIPTNR